MATDAAIQSQHAEEWCPVAGLEGRYLVSNLGRVWSVVTKRILRPGISSSGYPTVNLYLPTRPKSSKSFCVHSLVAEAFIGPRPEGMAVDHIDATKTNNSASNLRYVTPRENNLLAEPTRRRRRGSQHPNAKLTGDQVSEIRRRAGTVSRTVLCREYGVTFNVIRHIVEHRSYKNTQ